MATSQKPEVIERIYETLLNPDTGKLSRTIVTNDDIVRAIRWLKKHTGSTLSEKNPANFIKDVIRGAGAANMWPESLKKLRITAKQMTGGGNVFEFVPYAKGQTEPFPDRFTFDPTVAPHRIQSITVPLAAKQLGRSDETYLIQVAVKLAVIETHFALHSTQLDILEMSHLQTGIKLRETELDSVYSARFLNSNNKRSRLIVTVEAKKFGQRILEEQIVKQVKAAFEITDVNTVIPTAMTVVSLANGGRGIYVVEFKAIRRSTLEEFDLLEMATSAAYELVPPVKGI